MISPLVMQKSVAGGFLCFVRLEALDAQSFYARSVFVHLMKKVVKEAMARAKELEKKPVPRKEDVLKIYKEGLEEAKKLNKLLKPSWFISDTHKVPSRKKKTL